jgi:tRNA pseudouridine38-40 synthase
MFVMRVALKFAYNGKNFYGYARQPSLKTVEEEIINILKKNKLIKNTKESVFRSASRTDKGVSSLGSVVAFNTKSFKKEMLDSLNKECKDILFYAFKIVDDDFYPRYANLRQYRYYLDVTDLDFEKIVKTLSFFTGEHDFSNFARVETGKNPVRVIDNIVVSKSGRFLVIDFFAQNFLWNQIRRIISAVEKVGCEKISEEEIINALNNPQKRFDFGVAVAEPLILKDIFYDFEFEVDKKILHRLKLFEENLSLNLG